MKKEGILLTILVILSLSVTSINAAGSITNKFCITQVSSEDLRPSEVSTVSITIKNIGDSSAYYVATEVLLDEESPVKIIGRSKKSIDTSSFNSLGTDREVTVQYDFYVDDDAKATGYQIPLRITWSDKLGDLIFKNEMLYFGIRVIWQSKKSEIDVINVKSVPAEIEPGKNISIEVEFKNIGHSTVSLLSAGLNVSYPFTPLGSDLKEYIYELEPSEIATACFNIVVDRYAPSSYYKIPLSLVYEDEFGIHMKNTTIGISVKGAPRILIQEIILEPGKLTADTEGLFMIRLINTGTESAEDTKIRISGGDDILTEEHQFIGEIAPGESQTTTFGVSVNDEVEIGKHGLKISISYKDKSEASYSNSKIYEISIFATEPFIPYTYIYAFAAIAVLSIFVYIIINVRQEGKLRIILDRIKGKR